MFSTYTAFERENRTHEKPKLKHKCNDDSIFECFSLVCFYKSNRKHIEKAKKLKELSNLSKKINYCELFVVETIN